MPADTPANTAAVDRGQRPGAAALADVEPVPGVAKPDPIIIADRMTREFGGLRAVDVEHLEIQRGTITALIGPNGAGKTTFFNLMTGFDSPNTGTWSLNGNDLGSLRPHQIAHAGMVRTFQLTKALTRMSVMENMMLGDPSHPGERILRSILPGLWRSHEDEVQVRAEHLLERFKLDHMRDEYAGTLSGGQRKLLEMARALMVSPEVVMLDEPMAGVNPALTESLLGHVKSLPHDGMTVVFVEHDMDVVMDISDWVVVMSEGRIIAEGPPASIGTNQAVIDAYLGAHHDDRSAFEEGPAEIAHAEGRAASEWASQRARDERAAMGDTLSHLKRPAGGRPASDYEAMKQPEAVEAVEDDDEVVYVVEHEDGSVEELPASEYDAGEDEA